MDEKKEKKRIDDEVLDQVTGGKAEKRTISYTCLNPQCNHTWESKEIFYRCPNCKSDDIRS